MSVVKHTPQVEYRDIPGLPGYRVGDDSSVWSCWTYPSRSRPSTPTGPWKLMRSGKMMWKSHGVLGTGRRNCQVGILKNGVRRTCKVHHLVLEAFVGPRPEGMECRHLNGDPFDNRPENLAWGTRSENALDKVRHGRCCFSGFIGEKNPTAKLNEAQVREIRKLDTNRALTRKIALQFGVTMKTIRRIRRRDRHSGWAHVI